MANNYADGAIAKTHIASLNGKLFITPDPEGHLTGTNDFYLRIYIRFNYSLYL